MVAIISNKLSSQTEREYSL